MHKRIRKIKTIETRDPHTPQIRYFVWNRHKPPNAWKLMNLRLRYYRRFTPNKYNLYDLHPYGKVYVKMFSIKPNK